MSAERKRSLDINKLTAEDAQRISDQIGAQVRKICDDAVTQANELLNIYGMKAQMQIAILPINDPPKQTKTKRARPRKDTQSLS